MTQVSNNELPLLKNWVNKLAWLFSSQLTLLGKKHVMKYYPAQQSRQKFVWIAQPV